MLDNFSEIYYRYKAGLLDENEKAAFEKLLSEDKYNRFAAEGLSAISEDDYRKSLERFKAITKQMIEPKKSVRKGLKNYFIYVAIAASLLVAVVLIIRPKQEVLEQPKYSTSYDVINKPDSTLSLDKAHPPHNFDNYIQSSLIYPKQEMGSSISGSVVLSIEVKQDSTLGKIEVVQSLGEHFDKEAVRLIKGSGKWIPALKDGAPISSSTFCEIRFKE